MYFMEILISTNLHYIDPGSGGLFFQLIAGAAAAILVFGKNIYYRFKSIFKKKS